LRRRKTRDLQQAKATREQKHHDQHGQPAPNWKGPSERDG
jgi:hypothetical protein